MHPLTGEKTAIVTLVLGPEYQAIWRNLCASQWRAYADRHGYDIVAIERPLDDSPRASQRSPAWQKCLILNPSVCGHYDRVVWVDTDIIINSQAPAICAGVPADMIGLTDELQCPTAEEHRAIVDRVAATVEPRSFAPAWEAQASGPHWHSFWGLPERGAHILQTGVMVLSPRHHRELLEHVYHSYEDSCQPAMLYEMRPLSFEIQERGLHHLIDGRFNALISLLMFRDILLRGKGLTTREDALAFIRAELAQNYFLHFADRRSLLPMAKQVVAAA
jgi:hypothetical protein